MKLYHATSEFAWEQIQKIGFIGVTEEILLSYIRDIFERLNVPEQKREMYYKRARTDLEVYAPNGMVSFFPDYSEHMEYGRILGRILGESFGTYMKNSVKYASRVTKTSYKNNLEKFPFLIRKHVPVLLTVNVPRRLIANPDAIGTNTEHYTTGVVPTKYLVNMRHI